MSIDPVEQRKDGKNKALDAWAAMQAIHAERRANRDNHNSVGAAQTDNENKINDSNRDGFNTNAAQGQVGATGINAAQQGGQFSGGSSQQDFTGSSDTNRIDARLRQQEGSAKPVDDTISKLFSSGETPGTKEARYSVNERMGMMNEYARRGIQLDANVVADMDIQDVSKGRRAAAQAPKLQQEP